MPFFEYLKGDKIVPSSGGSGHTERMARAISIGARYGALCGLVGSLYHWSLIILPMIFSKDYPLDLFSILQDPLLIFIIFVIFVASGCGFLLGVFYTAVFYGIIEKRTNHIPELVLQQKLAKKAFLYTLIPLLIPIPYVWMGFLFIFPALVLVFPIFGFLMGYRFLKKEYPELQKGNVF